ncbi:cytochrome c oxidase assembly protein COX18, mitochondrial isoform X3 [Phyllostomus discolor]|uniref:Cytochrome c oxidase assembly protein COX18, mitochondrial isoform X3 n=1 Tax=Phyllostomus discolor TaxID=89673 RepID=A0A7E6DFL6_9CHIR|nr:cytochrome c oxidase assembly protein COX18, mitochondrial isoform X3 [Phyllostomus discolor]
MRLTASTELELPLVWEARVLGSALAHMLCRLGGRWLRPLPVLQLGAQGPQFAQVPSGGGERSSAPVWAVASVSAVSPGGAGGWYEALATSAPVRGAEELLLGAHDATGLPWWSTVVLTTVALRSAVTLPLAAYQHYILAKVENLQPEIKNIASHLNQEVAIRAHQLGWSKRVARLTYLKNMRRLVSELYVRDNCHPFKATVLVWIQIPMWIFMSVALRNLSTGAAHAEDFCSTKNRNVSFPDICYVLCSSGVCVDDPSGCDSTFIDCSLLVMLQLHGPFTELAAAFSQVPPTLPNTRDQGRFRHSL